MKQLQMKQVQCFQELAEQLKYSNNLSLNVASVHTDKRGTKRSHEDSDHDNELDMPQCKQSNHVDTQLDHAELDNILTHVEDGDQCEVEETTDTQETIDLKEVNQLMDELLEFYNDFETSAAVEYSLAKFVNASLRTQIPDSKFKEMKAKIKDQKTAKT